MAKFEYVDEHHPDSMQVSAVKTVKAARRGDHQAAKTILKDFAGAIGQFNARTWRGPVHWAFAEYIADAFKAMLAGEEAAKALGIKKATRGREKGGVTFDKSELGAAYWLLLRKGYRSEDAIEFIQEFCGADRRTIQRARVWAKERLYNNTKLYSVKDLQELAGEYAERIL
jgi:hypothetical protein